MNIQTIINENIKRNINFSKLSEERQEQLEDLRINTTSSPFVASTELKKRAITYTDLFFQNIINIIDFHHDFNDDVRGRSLINNYKEYSNNSDIIQAFFGVLNSRRKFEARELHLPKKDLEKYFLSKFFNQINIDNTDRIFNYTNNNNNLTVILDNYNPDSIQVNKRRKTIGYFFDSATAAEVTTINLGNAVWSRSNITLNPHSPIKVTEFENYNNFIRESFSDINGSLVIDGNILHIPDNFLQIRDNSIGQKKIMFFDNEEMLLIPNLINLEKICSVLTTYEDTVETNYIIDLIYYFYNQLGIKYNQITRESIKVSKRGVENASIPGNQLLKHQFILDDIINFRGVSNNIRKCKQIMIYAILMLCKLKTLGDYMLIREASLDNSLIFITSDKLAGLQAGLLNSNYLIRDQPGNYYFKYQLKEEANDVFNMFRFGNAACNGLINNIEKSNEIILLFRKIRSRLNVDNALNMFMGYTPPDLVVKMNKIKFILDFNLSAIQYMYLYNNIQNNIGENNGMMKNRNNNPSFNVHFLMEAPDKKTLRYKHPTVDRRVESMRVAPLQRMNSSRVYMDIYLSSEIELYKYHVYLIKKKFNTTFDNIIRLFAVIKEGIYILKSRKLFIFESSFNELTPTPEQNIIINQFKTGMTQIYNDNQLLIRNFLECYKNYRKIINIQKTTLEQLKLNKKNLVELMNNFLIGITRIDLVNLNQLIEVQNVKLSNFNTHLQILSLINYQNLLNQFIDLLIPTNNLNASWVLWRKNITDFVIEIIQQINVLNIQPEILDQIHNRILEEIKQKINTILSKERIREFLCQGEPYNFLVKLENYELINDLKICDEHLNSRLRSGGNGKFIQKKLLKKNNKRK